MHNSNKTQAIFAVLFFALFGILFLRPHEAVQQAFTFRFISVLGAVTQLEEDDDEELERIEFSLSLIHI